MLYKKKHTLDAKDMKMTLTKTAELIVTKLPHGDLQNVIIEDECVNRYPANSPNNKTEPAVTREEIELSNPSNGDSEILVNTVQTIAFSLAKTQV